MGRSEAVSAAADALERGSRRVALIGPEGSGKSRTLEAIAQSFHERAVLRLALPRRGDDAAVVGITSLATQLTRWDAGVLQAMRDPAVSWGAKLERVLSALAQTEGLLLLDDPYRARAAEPPDIFTRHAEELTQSVLSVDSLAVVVAARGLTGLPAARALRLEPDSDPRSELADVGISQRVRDAIECLGDTRDQLSRYGSLELRLIVACVMAGRSPHEFVERRWGPRELVLMALDGEQHAALRQVVGRLALVRTAFDDDLVGRVGGGALTSEQRELLDALVLLRKADGLVLHHLMGRHAIAEKWSGEQPEVTHRELAGWHRARFDGSHASQDVSDAVRNEIEVVHHLTEAKDVQGVFAQSLFFVDQYDALGKALSLDKRYADAVTAYERAIEHDVDDAYAHHYLGYNLDCLAEDEPRIEREYTKARQLEPSHVWYHGRLICFLITVGRLDAALDAWGEAVSELTYDDDNPAVPEELHRPVARLLLHRGQLPFAERVLADVPPALHEQDWYVALARRLHAMREAEREELVFPPVVSDEQRWAGPHLLRDPADSERVASWMPGRVTSFDEGRLRVRFAERGEERVRFRYESFSADELRQIAGPAGQGLTLPAGTFVELLTFEDGQRRLLSWQRQALSGLSLGAIFPPPDRFIRRAVAKSGA